MIKAQTFKIWLIQTASQFCKMEAILRIPDLHANANVGNPPL